MLRRFGILIKAALFWALMSAYALAATQAPVVVGSSANGVVVTTQGGALKSLYTICSVACYTMVFNASSIPSNGATTAGPPLYGPSYVGNMVHCFGPGTQETVNFDSNNPEFFPSGISVAISSTGCGLLTLESVAFIHAVYSNQN